MKIRNLAAVAAAATLVSAPVVAAERSAAPVEGESELAGGAGLSIKPRSQRNRAKKNGAARPRFLKQNVRST